MAMCAHSNKPGCPPKKVSREFSHKPKGGYKKKRTVPKPDRNGYY